MNPPLRKLSNVGGESSILYVLSGHKLHNQRGRMIVRINLLLGRLTAGPQSCNTRSPLRNRRPQPTRLSHC